MPAETIWLLRRFGCGSARELRSDGDAVDGVDDVGVRFGDTATPPEAAGVRITHACICAIVSTHSRFSFPTPSLRRPASQIQEGHSRLPVETIWLLRRFGCGSARELRSDGDAVDGVDDVGVRFGETTV